MYVEARVHYGLLQDEDAMSDLKRRVRDFICSQQTFSDGELPLTGVRAPAPFSFPVCIN